MAGAGAAAGVTVTACNRCCVCVVLCCSRQDSVTWSFCLALDMSVLLCTAQELDGWLSSVQLRSALSPRWQLMGARWRVDGSAINFPVLVRTSEHSFSRSIQSRSQAEVQTVSVLFFLRFLPSPTINRQQIISPNVTRFPTCFARAVF